MRSFFLVLALTLTGCNDATAPNGARVLGTIKGLTPADPSIQASINGKRVVLSIVTYGSSCYTVAETEVHVSGMSATIRPYDNTGTCSDRMLKQVLHSTSIDFPSTGTATLSITGIDASFQNANNLIGDTITVVREVAITK